MVSLDRCVGSCQTLDNLPNKTEDVQLKVFNMITRINQYYYQQNIFHMVVIVDLMSKNII